MFLIFLLHLRVNGSQLISHSFFDKTVQTLLLGNGINGGTFMKLASKPDIQASLISGFRFMAFFFAKSKIIVNSAMKISDQFRRIGAFIRNQGADALHFSKKHTIAFGKFYAADITFVFHCVFHNKPSCSNCSISCFI